MKDRMRSCLLSPNLTGYLSELPENLWVCTRATENFALIRFTFDIDLHEEEPWLVQDPSQGVGRSRAIRVHRQPCEGRPYKAAVHHQD